MTIVIIGIVTLAATVLGLHFNIGGKILDKLGYMPKQDVVDLQIRQITYNPVVIRSKKQVPKVIWDKGGVYNDIITEQIDKEIHNATEQFIEKTVEDKGSYVEVEHILTVYQNKP